MSKKIAMTGATGFAGRHAVSELLKRGNRIVALVRDPERANLPAGVDILAGHLEDASALANLVRGADAVVHLAGVNAAARAGDYFRYNALATLTLAEAASSAGVKRFVFASSLAAGEESLSNYGASKFAAEQALLRMSAHPPNTIILRAPAIYGPGDRATLPLIKQLTKRVAVIPGRREQRFSLLHVKDFARSIGDALDSEKTGIVELSDGTPRGYGWRDLVQLAAAAQGRKIHVIFLPKPVAAGAAILAGGFSLLTGRPGMVNPGKVRELYHSDWVAQGAGLPLADPITFARGFSETLAWYRQAGWLPARREADRSSGTFNRESKK